LQRQDPQTGIRFSGGRDTTGRAVVRVEGDGFGFEKTLTASGDAQIRIAAGTDVVSVSLTPQVITIARGKAAVSLYMGVVSQDSEGRLRRLLAGSRAVRAFRGLSAYLESRPAEEDDFFATSTLVDGALLSALDGDPGAIRRISRRLVARQLAGLRAARLRGATDRFEDCVGRYEATVYWAWGQFMACVDAASDDPFYIRAFTMNFCDAEWIARAETAAYQFVACGAFEL
jgi:hypothetical protein